MTASWPEGFTQSFENMNRTVQDMAEMARQAAMYRWLRDYADPALVQWIWFEADTPDDIDQMIANEMGKK